MPDLTAVYYGCAQKTYCKNTSTRQWIDTLTHSTKVKVEETLGVPLPETELFLDGHGTWKMAAAFFPTVNLWQLSAFENSRTA